MRVGAQLDIAAPAELVWKLVTDPTRTLHFMSGLPRWEVASAHDRGLGARYRTLMRVGSAEVGGIFETVEYDAPWELAWTRRPQRRRRADRLFAAAGVP